MKTFIVQLLAAVALAAGDGDGRDEANAVEQKLGDFEIIDKPEAGDLEATGSATISHWNQAQEINEAMQNMFYATITLTDALTNVPFDSKLEFEYCIENPSPPDTDDGEEEEQEDGDNTNNDRRRLDDEEQNEEEEEEEEETDQLMADCFRMKAQFDCIKVEGGSSDIEEEDRECDGDKLKLKDLTYEDIYYQKKGEPIKDNKDDVNNAGLDWVLDNQVDEEMKCERKNYVPFAAATAEKAEVPLNKGEVTCEEITIRFHRMLITIESKGDDPKDFKDFAFEQGANFKHYVKLSQDDGETNQWEAKTSTEKDEFIPASEAYMKQQGELDEAKDKRKKLDMSYREAWMNTGGEAKKVRDSYDTLKSVYGSAIDADKFTKWNKAIKAAEDDAVDTTESLQTEWCGSGFTPLKMDADGKTIEVGEECPAGLNKTIEDFIAEGKPDEAKKAAVPGEDMKAYEAEEETLTKTNEEMLAEFDLQADYVKYGIVREQAVSTTAYAATLAAVVYALAF